MSDRQKISRKKGTASNFSNPSLAPKIPRLAIRAHSDVESNNITAKKVESETSQEQALVTEEPENQENISLKSDSTIESFNYLGKISIYRPQETVQSQQLAENKQEQSEVVQRKLNASSAEDKQEELSPLSKAFQIQGNEENKLDSPIESFNYLERATIFRPQKTVQDGNLQDKSILQRQEASPNLSSVINSVRGNGKLLIQLLKDSEITSTDKGNGASKKTVIKHKTSRPSYGKGQVDAVWNAAPKDSDGKATCPNSGKKISWAPGQPRQGIWDMGHKTGHEYKTLWEKLATSQINYDQFLAAYQDPNNYQVEDASTNRSHKFEA